MEGEEEQLLGNSKIDRHAKSHGIPGGSNSKNGSFHFSHATVPSAISVYNVGFYL